MEKLEMKEHYDFLQQEFENVNGWLHFAEAKNAAMIAFNIALFAAVLSSEYLWDYIWLFSLILVGLLLSIYWGIISFWPIIKNIKKANKEVEENLLYFAYIATLDGEEYIKKLYVNYWNVEEVDPTNIPQIEKDYSDEIVVNSRITLRKQRYFEYSIKTTVFALIICVLLIICA